MSAVPIDRQGGRQLFSALEALDKLNADTGVTFDGFVTLSNRATVREAVYLVRYSSEHGIHQAEPDGDNSLNVLPVLG